MGNILETLSGLDWQCHGHTGGKVSVLDDDNAKVGWSLDGDNAGLEIGPLCPPH